MRTTGLCVIVIGLLAFPVQAQDVVKSGPATAKPAMANNAVLIGWDGAHRDHVKSLLKQEKLPNLQNLIDEGGLVDIEVTSGATDTKAGWSQVLTGYKPEASGVYSNGRFRDIPAGYSVFERLRAQFGADKIATVAVIGKQYHCGEIDPPFKRPYDPAKDDPAKEESAKKGKAKKQPGAGKARNRGRVVAENGANFVVFEGSPYYTMHNNVDQWRFGLVEDEKVGNEALAMLDKYGKKPLFFFVHFGEVDHQGHRFGEPSQQYDDAIISGDKQLGRIVEKLKELGVYQKTLIYVTADHGFDVGVKQHKDAPHVFLATNDKQVMRGGSRADITPTILDRLGVNTSQISPPLDGDSLAKPATRPPAKREVVVKGKGKGKGKKKKATLVQ